MDNEPVSELVEGALIALVGAVVGGGATACAAWLQARSSAKQQLDILRRQQLQQAATEVAIVLQGLGREFDSRVRCESSRRRPDCTNAKCYQEIDVLRKQFDRVYWLWVSWIPYPLRREIDEMGDAVGYNRKSYDDLMLELASKHPEYCPRCMHFDALGGHLPHLAHKVMQIAAVHPSSLKRTAKAAKRSREIREQL